MNKIKIPCLYCSKEITSNNVERHQIKCSTPTVTRIAGFNPRNTGKQGRNQFSKARDEGRIIPAVSSATRQKISDASKLQVWDTERRISHSSLMKEAVLANPESYSSSNRGRTKQIIIDNIKLQGQWEVDFYHWAKVAGLRPTRPTKAFNYQWNGNRSYFPDFYIESLGYVEVKGYETDRDRTKWVQFPELLFVVKEQAIKDIRNNIFTIDKLRNLLYTKLS